MMLSQDRFTVVFTVKFKINNVFTIKDSFEGQSNWNMNRITPLDYAMNVCIFIVYVFDDTAIL